MRNTHIPTLTRAYCSGQTEMLIWPLSSPCIGFLFSEWLLPCGNSGRGPADWGNLFRVAGVAMGCVWGDWEKKIPGSRACAIGPETLPSWDSWHGWCFGLLEFPSEWTKELAVLKLYRKERREMTSRCSNILSFIVKYSKPSKWRIQILLSFLIGIILDYGTEWLNRLGRLFFALLQNLSQYIIYFYH